MKAKILLICLAVGACAEGPQFSAERGYVLPAACQDTAALPHASVEAFMPRDQIQFFARTWGAEFHAAEQADAVRFAEPGGRTVIWISNDLSAAATARALAHERCHVLLGDWHN